MGKSTIFNALTAAGAEVASYPFCTIEPNVGIVPVPDARLDTLARLIKPKKVTPTTLEFFDIAGLVKDASKGEGLGNQFLAHIRNVDAIAHVVRCFADGDIAHPYGTLDPRRDLEVVDTELILADLEVVVNTAHSGFAVYDLPDTANARVLWGTGRGNGHRSGTPDPEASIQPVPPNPGTPAPGSGDGSGGCFVQTLKQELLY